jgi:hypothetical protein
MANFSSLFDINNSILSDTMNILNNFFNQNQLINIQYNNMDNNNSLTTRVVNNEFGLSNSNTFAAQQNVENLNKENENENSQKECKKPTRGALKVEFINDSKERANRKKKRKEGLLKKMNEFDTLTGSSSMFISIGMNENITEVNYNS